VTSLPLDDLLAAGGVEVTWTGPEQAPVVTVTLNRPATRNAQTPATWRALAAVGANLPTGTRVVVLKGAGPVFSSGIDLRTFTPEGIDGERVFSDIGAASDAEASDLIAVFQSAFSWWHSQDVITIAAVQGAAIGAGFQLALGCDFRVCSSDARFAMRETSLGLVPDLTGTHPLVRAVGYSRALEICLTGRWVSADEAAQLGLATVVVPQSELDAAVADLVAAILGAPAESVAATKNVLRAALDQEPERQYLTERTTQIGLIRGLIARLGQ
jgi:enoyl-CoA hydratase/carnithine racemase